VEPRAVAVEFNAAINARDLDGLARLMTDDHQFVDTEEHTVLGKDACLESWRGFFDQFPDYRNVFTTLIPRDNVVLVIGYSTCSFEPLDGPALWRAIVRDEKVAEWRVYADSEVTRQALAIA
jgi:ketosteroid isomerase-like protein